jgi:hypothetical protein
MEDDLPNPLMIESCGHMLQWGTMANRRIVTNLETSDLLTCNKTGPGAYLGVRLP